MDSTLFNNLLINPNAAKVYRDLRDYYLKLNMKEEAFAFTLLLEERFSETRKWQNDVILSDINIQQSADN